MDDDDDDSGRSSPFCFVDFAFLDGKVFPLDRHGVTAVFDAATLEVLDLVEIPPETPNFSTKIFPYVPNTMTTTMRAMTTTTATSSSSAAFTSWVCRAAG